MANNPNPDFIQEVMFEEHGTKVLITDPAADRYLEEHKKKKTKTKVRRTLVCRRKWLLKSENH